MLDLVIVPSVYVRACEPAIVFLLSGTGLRHECHACHVNKFTVSVTGYMRRRFDYCCVKYM